MTNSVNSECDQNSKIDEVWYTGAEFEVKNPLTGVTNTKPISWNST